MRPTMERVRVEEPCIELGTGEMAPLGMFQKLKKLCTLSTPMHDPNTPLSLSLSLSLGKLF
jgi:hypothetical protein